MKKTLCKAIHNADNGLFICIEDIWIVRRYFATTVSVYGKGMESPQRFDTNSEEEAIDLENNIIKELEEYYGIDNQAKGGAPE